MRVLFAALLSVTAMGQEGGEWRYVARGGNISWLGNRFSEENGGFGPEATQEGFAGWACYGGNCDDRQMRYFKGGPMILKASNNNMNVLTARDISEEGGRSNMNCGPKRLLSQLRCKGGNCDNTDVYCRDLAQGYRVDPNVGQGFYTGWFSEEHPNWFMDCPPSDPWVWGFQCEGGRCDNQRLRCAKVQKFFPAVNCEVSEWGAWTDCTEACGGGEQTHSRTVTKTAAYGGAACPALTEKRECNTQSCTPSPTPACQGKKNQYANTLTKVKKGENKFVKLQDDDSDPICECYDLCNAEKADIYLYYVKGNGTAKCKCMTGNQDKFKLNMKARNGYTSGSITADGKKYMDQKKSKKTRRRRG